MALLATICTGAAQASIYAPGGGLIVTKEQEDVTITQDTTGITAPAINGTTQYAPFVKDGAGNAVIDGNLNMTAALYVREGKLTISGTDTTVTINPGWGSLVSGNAPTIFSVAGTNTTGSNSEDIYATLVIDGATVKTAQGAALNVGGPDGNGALLLTNGAKVYNTPQGSSLFIGYEQSNIKASNVHGTTVSGTDSTRYQGSYTPSADNEVSFGRGIVTVEGGSELWTGYSGLYLGEGELNISGNSKVYSGYDSGKLEYANPFVSQLGAKAHSTSVVNITDGGLLSIGGYLCTGCYDTQGNTKVTINIEDKGSVLSAGVKNAEAGHFAYLGTAGKITSDLDINITKGGHANFYGVYMGAEEEEHNQTVDISVDSQSSMKVNTALEMYNGAVIDNKGTTTTNDLSMSGSSEFKNDGTLVITGTATLNGGKLVNNGTISNVSADAAEEYAVATLAEDADAFLITVATGATYENNGTNLLATLVDGGSLTLGANSVNGIIRADSGDVEVLGDCFTDTLTLNGGNITFALGAQITMADGASLYIGDDVTFVVNVGSIDNLVGLEVELFTNVADTSALDGTIITLVDTQKQTTQVTVSAIDNGFKVTGVVPEPTTATLSLLALAALAARRRRS